MNVEVFISEYNKIEMSVIQHAQEFSNTINSLPQAISILVKHKKISAHTFIDIQTIIEVRNQITSNTTIKPASIKHIEKAFSGIKETFKII